MSKKEKFIKVLKIVDKICWGIIGGVTLGYIWEIMKAKKEKLEAETEFYSSQARFTRKMNCDMDD